MHGSSGEASTSKTSPPVPAKTPALPAATPTPAKRDVATPPAEKQGVAPAPGLVELSQEKKLLTRIIGRPSSPQRIQLERMHQLARILVAL